jgi:prepilin-type N-terminal cleavage/methylation domain-containing protein
MRIRTLLRDERGLTLPELLIGITVTSIIMFGLANALWTSERVRETASDQLAVAQHIAAMTIFFDRDTANSADGVPAESQTTETGCSSTQMDLGAVTYDLRSSAQDGPNWLVRISGGEELPVLRFVTACTWQVVHYDNGTLAGRPYLVLQLSFESPRGRQISHTFRGAPRQW